MRSEELERLILGPGLLGELISLFDDVAHALFYFFEVVGSKRPWKLHIIVEAVLDGRSYAEPGLRENLADSSGHDVRSRMAQAVEAVVSLGREISRSERYVLIAVYLFSHSSGFLRPSRFNWMIVARVRTLTESTAL